MFSVKSTETYFVTCLPIAVGHAYTVIQCIDVRCIYRGMRSAFDADSVSFICIYDSKGCVSVTNRM